MKTRRLIGLSSLAVVLLTTSTPLWSAEVAPVSPPAPSTETAVPLQPSSSAATQSQEPLMDVRWQDGLLSVKAEMADLAALLKRVREESHICIEIGEGVSGTVTVSFNRLSLEDGVGRILEVADSKNFVAEFVKSGEQDGISLKKISVVRKADDHSATGLTTTTKERFRTQDDVRAWLKEKYGTDWWVSWRTWQKNAVHFSWSKGKIPGLTPPGTPEEARVLVDKLLPQFIELLEIPPDQLRHSETYPASDSYNVYYDHFIDKVPVDMSRIVISYHRNTQEISVSNGIKYGIDIPTRPEITAEQAARKAEYYFRALTPANDIRTYEGLGPLLKSAPVLAIRGVPISSREPDELVYHLVWAVEYPTVIYHIDARSGELVDRTVTVVPAMETIAGELKGQRYGHFLSAQYIDDDIPGMEGLPGLPIWTINDDWTLAPSSSMQSTNPNGQFLLTVSCPFPGCAQDISSRLQTNDFRIYTGQTDSLYLKWAGKVDGYSYVFPDDAVTGHQPNIFHQLQRGLGVLANDRIAGNQPPFLSIRAGVTMSPLGTARGNEELTFSVLGARSSDIIFHELAHAAVYTIRTKHYLGIGDSQWAINEGLATFFACDANRDRDFSLFTVGGQPIAVDLDQDPNGVSNERVPRDWNKDKVKDQDDWTHYGNGFVFASLLWDLSSGGTANPKIWEAAKGMVGYRPGEFYEELGRQGTDSKLLWEAYSKHEMNLLAEPDGAGIVNLTWLAYQSASATYLLQRSEYSNMSSPVLISHRNPDGVSAKDPGPLVSGKTYYYRVVVQGVAPAVDPAVVSFQYTGLSAPQNLRIEDVNFNDADQYEFKLKWDPLNVSGAAVCAGASDLGYRIHYKKTNEADWAQYPSDANPTTFHSGEASIPQEHGVGTVYEYQVAAYCSVSTGTNRGEYFGPLSEEPKKFPSAMDVVILVARSSRWMHSEFSTAVNSLVYSITRKLTPNESGGGSGIPGQSIRQCHLSRHD